MKVAVITGASSGLGEATGRLLARHGFAVALAARREERLSRIAEEIQAGGGRALPVRTDVTDVEELRRLVAVVDESFGRCDVLVNNAGIPAGGSFASRSLEQLDAVLDTNLRSVVWGTKLFLPMLETSRGHVVNVASLAGRYAAPGAAIYTAAKHGVVALSESLHHELRTRGVAVTAVAPGLFPTEGFPLHDLRADPRWRWVLTSKERVAEVILDVVRTRKGPAVSVPRWQAAFQAFRVLTPPVYYRAVGRLGRWRGRRT